VLADGRNESITVPGGGIYLIKVSGERGRVGEYVLIDSPLEVDFAGDAKIAVKSVASRQNGATFDRNGENISSRRIGYWRIQETQEAVWTRNGHSHIYISSDHLRPLVSFSCHSDRKYSHSSRVRRTRQLVQATYGPTVLNRLSFVRAV
jgi:hypothetical protein